MEKSSMLFEEIVAFRHALHRHPELGGHEIETMRQIRKRLAALPVEVLPPFLGTDTVALCRGKAPGKSVALRADIDALPVTEETQADFASEIPGVMHACGHDVHAAILLGAAAELCRRDFSGTLRFVWQPGEEKFAMGEKLVAAGALEDPAPDFVFALHVSPDLPFGAVGCRCGTIMASSTHFEISVTGRGGHGSAPQKARSPLLAAAEIALALEKLAAKNPDAALSVGILRGGTMENVIPDTAGISGTLRTVADPETRRILGEIENICISVDAVRRTHTCMRITRSYLPTVNDPEAVEIVRSGAFATPDAVYTEIGNPAMTAEDFSFYLKHYRGAMLHLGIGALPPLHNSKLLVPDAIIPLGVKLLVSVALEALL